MSTITFILACSSWVAGQDVSGPHTEPAKKTASAPAITQSERSLSDAERIAKLQRSVESDKKELQTLKERLEDPANEFVKAQNEFQKLDTELSDKKRTLKELMETGNTEDAAELQFHVETLTTSWQLLRDRSNLAIQERKTFQQKITVLTERIHQTQQTLDTLSGATVAAPTTAEKKTTDNKTQTNQDDKKKPAVTESSSQAPTASASTDAHGITLAKMGDAQLLPRKTESKELKKAKQDAEEKQAAAEVANEKVQSLNDRITTLRENITLDQNLLETARKKLDNIQRTFNALEKDQNHKIVTSASREELQESWRKLSEERLRSEQARLDVRNITNHLNQLQEELMSLQGEQIDALREADRKRTEAESARQLVAHLENPFAPRNLLQWLLHNGPKVLLIVTGMLVLHRVVRVFCLRMVEIITRSRFHKGERELENRAQTLAGVFRNVSSIIIWGGGTLMLLDTIYVPVVPLLGGAAVIGLAVAFGAQNLIRDYFSGFMILVEDQYAVNDVVKIGEVSGQVERISLRTTVVRDGEGNLHFIPHGNITGVSNLSHGWSRAVFVLNISYSEKVERVMDVVRQLGREIRRDPDFGPMILDDLEMLGVDNFGDSAVTIKFLIKTKPLKQWTVKREVFRRIKNRFDEMGIDFPYPTRTILHRNATADVDMEEEEAEMARAG